MKILFVLDHKLMHYRVPLFTLLTNKGYDITVAHSGKFIDNCNFKQLIVNEKKIFNLKYKRIKKNNIYNIVIQMQNLHYLNVWLDSLNPFRKYKLIDWTIGTSSTNGLSLDITITDKIRNLLSSFNNDIILYSDFAKFKYSLKNKSKIIIANNTILNPNKEDLSTNHKDSFLFIGSINRRKGLGEIISSFKEFINNDNTNIKYLHIIGDGPELDNLKLISSNMKLSGKVIFYGKINDFKLKKEIFKRSIVNISPNQAGLSVLESFSFGIPFITKKNAISGGEHMNVIHNETGLLYEDEKELLNLMNYANNNIKELQNLGRNAYKYYNEKRDFSNFVNSFDCLFQKYIKDYES